MCSLAGSKYRVEVERMLQVQKHRSPDEMGISEMDRYCIGMGRLSIIDLKSKNLCPFTDGRYILTYNGEIYNYIELKKELINKGYKFTTTSDTEVLLNSYKEWGRKCLDKFNGMFAFAIYDIKKEEIFLARDIAGEKPLYYKEYPFKFASEAKALHLECKEFPPASYAYYNLKKNKLSKIKRYWELTEVKIKNPVEELEELLKDAVKIRTRSDVPYALYYSGGVDSSLISTFHDFEYKFTYKDSNYEKEFKEDFINILWHLDYPVEHFSPFALWKLAKMASEKVKVVISGEGADELFGGYVRYIIPHLKWQANQKFPSYAQMFDGAENVNDAGLREFEENLRVLLRMGDRMSSAFGLENRCPFLDKRIINFAFSLPHEMKIDNFQLKVILNKILMKRNPVYEPIEKQGLFCSVNKWIGSKEMYTKNDYMFHQNEIWKKFLLRRLI